MADGMRKNAVKTWVTSPKHFGMLEMKTEVPGKKAGTMVEVKVIVAGKMKAKSLDIKFLINSRWWEMTKEPEFHAYNFTAKVTALVVEADRIVKRGDKRDQIDTEGLSALRELEQRLAA